MSASRLAAIALLGVTASCTSKPTFYGEDGVRTYGCYLDEGARSAIDVTFSDQGRAAAVTVDGKTHYLNFRGSRWFRDVYANDTVELRLDPEAFIAVDGEQIAGPCT